MYITIQPKSVIILSLYTAFAFIAAPKYNALANAVITENALFSILNISFIILNAIIPVIARQIVLSPIMHWNITTGLSVIRNIGAISTE